MNDQRKAPGDVTDPSTPQTIENPGDPGPPTVVPATQDDPRKDPKLPSTSKPEPGV